MYNLYIIYRNKSQKIKLSQFQYKMLKQRIMRETRSTSYWNALLWYSAIAIEQ